MKVKFFITIQENTGCSEIEVEGCRTVQELLLELSDRYGEKFRKAVFAEKNELSNDIIVLVNGRSYGSLRTLQVELQPEDVITILPALIGG